MATSRPQLRFAPDVDAVGIGEAHALNQKGVGDVALMNAFEFGKLDLAVDPSTSHSPSGWAVWTRKALGHRQATMSVR